MMNDNHGLNQKIEGLKRHQENKKYYERLLVDIKNKQLEVEQLIKEEEYLINYFQIEVDHMTST